MWRVAKDTRTAEARIRDVPGYGWELRFLVRDALVYSAMFRDRRTLEQLAAEKLAAFKAFGWVAVAVHCRD